MAGEIRWYQDCDEPDVSLGCVTWVDHMNIVIKGSHAALDRDGVRGLVGQLQKWLDT